MDQPSTMKLHLATLRFAGESADLEAPFQAANFRASLPHNRAALVIGALFYAVFGILDAMLMPEFERVTWFIRYAVVVPAIAALLLFSFSRAFERFASAALASISVVAGIAPPPVNYSYYAGVLLVLIWNYTFARIPFPWATAAGWLLVLFYEVAAIWISPTPFIVLLNNNFFFISANIMGMIACYSLEYYIRRDYFLTRQVEADREKIAATNRELASQSLEYQTINLALTKEITERRKAEKALFESEERYRSIFENAKEGIYQSTPDGRFIYANASMARTWGYETPEEMMTEIVDIAKQHYVDPEGRQRFMAMIEEEGNVEGYRMEIHRKDGSRIWISVNARAVRDVSGKILYYEGTNEDITEQKLLEDMILENERRYRYLVENSSDIIYTTDLRGTLTYVNPAMERVTGYAIRQMFGHSVYNLVRTDYREPMKQFHHRLLSERNASAYFEFPIVTIDGTEKWLGQEMQMIYEKSETVGYQATARDITDRLKAGEEQREREKLSAIVETAGMICHEMNQPMQVILGHAEHLAMIMKDDGILGPRLGTIKEQIAKMSDITRKLMNMTRYHTKPYVGKARIVDLDKSAD
ncbi:MAG: Sporulation kinase E [Syntrophaceae bacterium PtaU1.Bin231]|nr:MAG: Sporulation kinase E [Syntrophaceae bacterium PtaU1.Bin231]